MKEKVILLGGSGSIGAQTLDVIRQHPERFELDSISVGKRTENLPAVIDEFHPASVTVRFKEDHDRLCAVYPKIRWYYGDEGILTMLEQSEGDFVVNALMGFVGLRPTARAIELNKKIALANKETLVAGGSVIMRMAKRKGIRIRPIDSEHSAIWQCLQGTRRQDLDKLIITASGGSLRNLSRSQLKNVTVEQALAHPNWNMGQKITIDSATMMNKGFEVIEAHWLFDVDYDHIETLLHPQSMIHSMVQYKDHSIIAQLGVPDMRVPIQYAMLYPDHDVNLTKPLDLAEVGQLTFDRLSLERYPLLGLAYKVGKKGGNLGAVMNAANEKAVALFLNRQIAFTQIEEIVFKTVKDFMQEGRFIAEPTLEDILQANAWGLRRAQEVSKV